jgi:hypothetical protein
LSVICVSEEVNIGRARTHTHTYTNAYADEYTHTHTHEPRLTRPAVRTVPCCPGGDLRDQVGLSLRCLTRTRSGAQSLRCGQSRPSRRCLHCQRRETGRLHKPSGCACEGVTVLKWLCARKTKRTWTYTTHAHAQPPIHTDKASAQLLSGGAACWWA